MKRAIVFLVMLGLASFVAAQSPAAQSLTGLARLEKARRASLAGRRAPVITNADLFRVKLRPAVEIGTPPEEEAVPAEENPEGTVVAVPGQSTPPEGEAGVAPDASAAPPPGPAPATADVITGLREKLRTAEEQIDLYKTKIAALNQDYSSQTSMTPNYVIEQQLTETLQKLQATQAEAVRLQRDIDKAVLEKRLARNAER